MKNQVIQVKKLELIAKIPQRQNPGDAGLDLISVEEITIPPGEWRAVGTGIALELPEGMEAQVRPRSGMALNHGVTVLNSPGTIDAGYRGEIKVLLINHHRDRTFTVVPGMRIAQLVVAPIILATFIETNNELSLTERNDKGFGSTGV